MSVSTTAVHYSIGEAWNDISGTTTTIVGNLITEAENVIKLITSTTTNYDQPIRSYACYLTLQNLLGGRSYASINVGGVSLSEKRMIEQSERFREDAVRFLKLKGFTFDGNSIKFTQVND